MLRIIRARPKALIVSPTLAALALSLWSKDRSGSEQLLAVFGGMFLRMAVALGVGLAVFLSTPQFRESRERELV